MISVRHGICINSSTGGNGMCKEPWSESGRSMLLASSTPAAAGSPPATHTVAPWAAARDAASAKRWLLTSLPAVPVRRW